MWAVTPHGVGNPTTARTIEPDWELSEGETFKADEWSPDKVLAEDEVSLRDRTQTEQEIVALEQQIAALDQQLEAVDMRTLRTRGDREYAMDAAPLLILLKTMYPLLMWLKNGLTVQQNEEVASLQANFDALLTATRQQLYVASKEYKRVVDAETSEAEALRDQRELLDEQRDALT